MFINVHVLKMSNTFQYVCVFVSFSVTILSLLHCKKKYYSNPRLLINSNCGQISIIVGMQKSYYKSWTFLIVYFFMVLAFSTALSLWAFSDLFLIKWVPSSFTFIQKILLMNVPMYLITYYIFDSILSNSVSATIYIYFLHPGNGRLKNNIVFSLFISGTMISFISKTPQVSVPSS